MDQETTSIQLTLGLTKACLPVVVRIGGSGIFHANTFAVFQLVPMWNWYKLPKSYLESPYLSADNEALTAYFEEEGIVGAQTEEHGLALNLDEKEGEGCSTNYQWSEIPSKSKVFSQSHLTPIFTESLSNDCFPLGTCAGTKVRRPESAYQPQSAGITDIQ